MRDILPYAIPAVTAKAEDWTGTLLPEEEKCLSADAVIRRRRDFTAGRVCARRALTRLGVWGVPIPVGSNRAPQWPAGITGSITHTQGYCAAAAARTTEFLSIGIDAERSVPLSHMARAIICQPREVAWCASHSDDLSWPLVIFSAKECVYKLWSQLGGGWLDYHDVFVECATSSDSFVAYISMTRISAAYSSAALGVVAGRFAIDSQLVRTAAWAPR